MKTIFRRRLQKFTISLNASALSLLLAGFLLILAASGLANNHSPGQEPDVEAEVSSSVDNSPSFQYRETARQIRELVEGTLDAGILVSDLFDVRLDDEDAVRLEAGRLRALIEAADGRAAAKSVKKGARKKDAQEKVGSPDSLDPEVWAARLDLDRARLAFFSLSSEERAGLLAAHEEKRNLDAEARAAAELNESRRRAREAEEEQLRVLEAAQRARSEAEKLLKEEKARLLGIASDQAHFETDLVRQRQVLQQRAETTLGLRRRTREIIQDKLRNPQAVDDLYDQLRLWLRQSRDEFAAALFSRKASIPHPGEERFFDFGLDIDTESIERTRRDLLQKAADLEKTANQSNFEQLRQLYGEMVVLNTDRLSLLPHLSADKRASLTGFSAAGLDQAASELRQISLVLKYRVGVARKWIRLEEDDKSERTEAVVKAGLTAMKWSFAISAFLWWRRRIGPLLREWQQRIQKEEHHWRGLPSRRNQSITLALRIRRPLEWLLLAWALILLMPDSAGNLLEVSLATSLFTWTLGGWLAVATINEMAATRKTAFGRAKLLSTGAIRLRSLRLIGRTVVLFGLALTLTDQLVGHGTIYHWVLSVCWVASIPVFLIVIRWWQQAIFVRIELIRKKGPFERWVIAHRSGWTSFVAAVAGGVYLFLQGIVRAIQNWSVRFDIARRIHAYLFRRGLDKLAEERHTEQLAPLPDSLFTALAPEIPSAVTVPSSADEEVGAVIERIRRIGGGVFAVVGERGAGKSHILQQVSKALDGIVLLDCPKGGIEQLCRELVGKLDMATDADLEEAAALLDAGGEDSALLVDNAHRLIRPVIGGLAGFDHLLQVARSHSSRLTWILAMDKAVWRFLEQARGSRPLFDEVIHLDPWREEEIIALLTSRCEQAEIWPSFNGLIEELPADADEVDREEAAARAAAGYYRLLWDYAAGNPGVALHMWRRSLGLSASNEVCVNFFRTPDARELDGLPDSAVFVLKAVVQLEPAEIQEIISSTMLGPAQVADALRYGLAHGYLERDGDGYRITWGWFRTITRYLQRRYLLASSR
ncbi:MAG: ATP-binding protein [Syntrophotaleaceae bacterium]